MDGRKFSEVLMNGVKENKGNIVTQVKQKVEPKKNNINEEKFKIVYGTVNPEQMAKLEKCIIGESVKPWISMH